MSELTDLERHLTDALHSRAASASPPPDAWERIVAELDVHTGEPVLIDLEPATTDEADSDDRPLLQRSRIQLGIAASILVLLGVVGAALLLSRDDDDAAPTASFGVDTAELTTDRYFSAFNAGDADAVVALFAPDMVVRWNFDDMDAQIADRSEWAQNVAWNTAQGTSLDDEQCEVSETTDTSVTISCLTRTRDALTQAVQSLPVETIITMIVTPAGIVDLAFTYGATVFDEVGTRYSLLAAESGFTRVDFTHAGVPFGAWVASAHPEAAAAMEFGSWSSAAEARATGLLRAELARKWAAYLVENDCGLAEPAPNPPTTEYVGQEKGRLRCLG